jgi:hypothetical protein
MTKPPVDNSPSDVSGGHSEDPGSKSPRAPDVEASTASGQTPQVVANDGKTSTGENQPRKGLAPKWDNPKSIPTFGHAFTRHGKKIKAASLADRAAAEGVQIGQFLDEEVAAAHIANIAQTRGQGTYDISLPPGLRTRVMLPTRVEVPADMMRVVVNADGLITTSFPYSSQHPTQ